MTRIRKQNKKSSHLQSIQLMGTHLIEAPEKGQSPEQYQMPQRPQKGQPLIYYLDYLKALAEDGNRLEMQAGYLRWLQGHGFIEAEISCKIKHGDKKKLYEAAGVPKSTYYACRAVAKTVTSSQAKKRTWTEMLVVAGYIKNGETKKPKPRSKPEPSKTLDESNDEPVVIQARSRQRDVADTLEATWKEFAEVELNCEDREYCIAKIEQILTSMQGMVATWRRSAA